MLETGTHKFDVKGKGEEWHTAFYYLAEHVRYLSDGRINHKEFYALVGTAGRYVNHANPIVRKSTAGALSRIVHTRRYVQDLTNRYLQNSTVFDTAASKLCSIICEARGCTGEELAEYLSRCCWPDVLRGLEHEQASWRGGLDLLRAGWEAHVLLAECGSLLDPLGCDGFSAPAAMLAAFLHITAFGHLEFSSARTLIDKRPTGPLVESGKSAGSTNGACLVKFTDAGRSGIAGSWALPSNRPFIVGRYTDCDALELDECVSRIHCCVYYKNNEWLFEDMGSRNGSRVNSLNGHHAYDSRCDGSRVPVRLQGGDSIVLADRSVYWFGSLGEACLNTAFLRWGASSTPPVVGGRVEVLTA